MVTKPLSSSAKFDAMVNVFSAADGKLNRGEVDAIAGFYKGLSPTSQAKIADQVTALYRGASYWSGQQERFFHLLVDAGLPLPTLEGQSGDSVQGFASLSHVAQFESMSEHVFGWSGDYDHLPKIVAADIPLGPRAKISVQIKKFIAENLKEDQVEDSMDTGWHSSHLMDENGKIGEQIGYLVQVVTEYGGATGANLHFFNLKGEHIGKEYNGE